MGQWVEAKATNELRFVERKLSDGEFTYIEKRLQQLWKISRGGLGRVEYSEEWRDIPVVNDKDDSDGR